MENVGITYQPKDVFEKLSLVIQSCNAKAHIENIINFKKDKNLSIL